MTNHTAIRESLYVNQVKAIEWGLNLQEATMFNFLYELPTWTPEKEIDGNSYHPFSKNDVFEELPILSNKPNTIAIYLQTLDKKGLIERKVLKNKSFIRITEKGNEWGGCANG